MRLIKDTLASIATKHFPGLLARVADGDARRDILLRVAPFHIDIVRRCDQATIRLNRANAVYAVDIMNSFEYYFGSVRPKKAVHAGKRFPLVDFSQPCLHDIKGFDDFAVVCPSLAEPFVTTTQYMDVAGLAPDGVVIDLGCYCGLTSIAFAKAVGPTGRIIALEPDPRNFAAAVTNIAQYHARSGVATIDLLQMAVSDRSGELTFSSEGSMGSAAASLVGSYRGHTLRVASSTLDDLAVAQNLQKVDFIKMDIEGSEEAVLASSESFLARFRPTMVIEPHMVNGTLSAGPVQTLLTRFGYRCSILDQTGVSLPLIVARAVH